MPRYGNESDPALVKAGVVVDTGDGGCDEAILATPKSEINHLSREREGGQRVNLEAAGGRNALRGQHGRSGMGVEFSTPRVCSDLGKSGQRAGTRSSNMGYVPVDPANHRPNIVPTQNGKPQTPETKGRELGRGKPPLRALKD